MSRFSFDKPGQPIPPKPAAVPGRSFCRPGIPSAAGADKLSVVRGSMDSVKPDQQYVFLLGNGINLYHAGKFPTPGKDSVPAWHDILIQLAKKFAPDNGSLMQAIDSRFAPLPDTELFQLLQLIVSQNGQDANELLNDLSRSVNVPWVSGDTIALLDYLKNKPFDVLTTNFDFNLERYFWKIPPERQSLPGATKLNNVSHYPWNRCRFEKEDGCRVWHIHGDVQYPNSILFSLSRYVKAGVVARELLKDENLDKLQGTWLYRFLNRPLVIMGLGLGQSEIFLRWLLWERVIWQRHCKLELPPSYYLCRNEDKNPVQEQFMNVLGFQTLYGDAETLYNGKIWK